MDTTRRDRAVLHTAGLTVSVIVFAWPQLSLAVRGETGSYPLVTALFTLLIVALVMTWPADGGVAAPGAASWTTAVPIVAVAAGGLLLLALYRWMRLLAWQPYQADMLIVVREATRRFLTGHTPYTTYRTYDAPWETVMPYGPMLWGPFLLPQLLRIDFRIVTIIGELFVPLWCGVTAVVEAARGRLAGAAAWLALLAALVLAFDVQGFTLIGHTPVYWPLLPLLAVAVGRRRWMQAACVLGLLVAARSTMVALIPVLLIAVWIADRRRLAAVTAVLAITIAVVFAPFVVWDPRAIWDCMVLSYPRVIKAAVWPVLARKGIETIGVTEWLLEQHRDALVTPVQVLVMLGVYGATWSAIRRGARPLPWMALPLFAFSMTTLYPVHYLYYDVLLLLASGAMVATLEAGPARMTAAPWILSLTALVAVTFAALRLEAAPFPHAAAGEASRNEPLRGGFARSERDGPLDFSWIVGREATIVLPRSSAAAAQIVITAQSPFDADHAPQRVTVILNGSLLGELAVPAGWHDVRIDAPRSTWWAGFNQLQLVFSTTMAPRDAGAGDDPRPLALGLSRVDVMPLAK